MPEDKDFTKMIDEVVDNAELAPPELTDAVEPDIMVETSVPKVSYVRPKDANVQLAPSKKDQALNEGITNIGRVSITIPNKEAQIGGFYSKDANVLINQYPQFKYIDREKKVDKTKKGE